MLTVIIIASDQTIALRADTALRKAGIHTVLAKCMISGIELALKHQADLLLCEEILEDLTAIDLLEIKKSNPQLSKLPVMVCSSSITRSLEHFEAGCDEYILLPFHLDELPHRVRAVLRRTKTSGVSGNFSHLSMLELVQTLINAGKNGHLSVDCGNLLGSLYLKDGQVFNASCEEAEGEEAFLKILRNAQHGGSFNFSTNIQETNIPTNINKRTDHLLLGLANILDEEH